jgi:hypothetical protein
LNNVVENKQFISIGELIRKHSTWSAESDSALGMVRWKFDEHKVKKMLEKCKQTGMKLTGALNMLLIIAFQTMHERCHTKLEEISYMNSVSLRQFLPDNLKPNSATFSYMANFVPVVFDLRNGENDTSVEYLLRNFWTLAKEESNTLHKKISNNQQYRRFLWKNNKIEENQLPFYFYLSNIGGFSQGCDDAIQIQESYMNMDRRKNVANFRISAYFALTSVVSINNVLCWSWCYNTTTYERETIEELSRIILELSDKILEN